MLRLWSRLLLLLVLLAPLAAAQDEVRVLRSRRALSYLSSNGNGASIYRAETHVDLGVRNVAFAKQVGVRWTSDDWRTWNDAAASYVGPLGDGTERWRVTIDHGTIGTNVMLGGERGNMGPAFVRFAAYLRANGRERWDNARGADHAVALCAPAAEPLPQARRAPKVVMIDRVLYLVGGQESEGYRFTVPDVLRLDGSSWTRVAAMPQVPFGATPGPTHDASVLAGYEVAAVGRRLFVLGGTMIKIGTRSTATLSLDVDSGAWTVGAPLPGPLHDREAVVVGREVHLVPASRGRAPGDTDRAFVLDTTTGAWRSEAVTGLDLLAGAAYVTAALDGKLYFFGGRNGLRDALAYDARTRTVTRLGTVPADLTGVEPAVALGGLITIANVDVDLGRGDAAALVFDPAARDFVRLARRPMLPFETTLAAAPRTLVAGPGGNPVRRVDAAFAFTGTSRVDTWLPPEGVLAQGESRTVLRVQRAAGLGHRVTVRGGAGPLRWDGGQDARWSSGDVWTFETTDLLEETLAWKPLVDDGAWFPGADLRVRKGETQTITWSW
jgi:hypothetical protein